MEPAVDQPLMMPARTLSDFFATDSEPERHRESAAGNEPVRDSVMSSASGRMYLSEGARAFHLAAPAVQPALNANSALRGSDAGAARHALLARRR